MYTKFRQFKMKKASVVLVGLFIIIASFQPAWTQKEKYHSIFKYSYNMKLNVKNG